MQSTNQQSQTQTETPTPLLVIKLKSFKEDETKTEETDGKIEEVLKKKVKKASKVVWAEDTVDNENLNRLKSNRNFLYKKTK